MLRSFLARWQGLVLTLIGVVATAWLTLSGQLGLYIHPRYGIFTVVMCAIGGVLAIAAFAVPRESAPHHEDPRPGWRTPLRVAGSVVIAMGALFALLVLPPATLTESTAQKRAVNSSFSNDAVATSNSYEGEETIGEGTDVSAFTVKDWAIVLQLGMSEQFLSANPADLVGFISADEADPSNVFYVARFDIACCAVDATPYGVAVYSPGWQERLEVGEWVQVRGILVPNPSTTSTEKFAIEPTEVTPIAVPADPYLY